MKKKAPIFSIIALEPSLESTLIRDIVEVLGYQALMFRPGQPLEVLTALKIVSYYGSSLVLSGHGQDGGFLLGEYAEHLDTSMLHKGVLRPEAIAPLSIGPLHVVSTCCTTGKSDMADAFRQAGATSFTAPPNWPDGRLVPLFLHIFLKSAYSEALSLRRPYALPTRSFPTLMTGFCRTIFKTPPEARALLMKSGNRFSDKKCGKKTR